MLRACGKCGRIHSDSYDCGQGFKRKYKETDETKLRSQYSWKVKREIIREQSLYLCAVCRDQGDYSAKRLEVHHVKKLRDDPSGLLDDNNLICLCTEHHKQADDGKLSEKYLRELINKRDGGADILLQ